MGRLPETLASRTRSDPGRPITQGEYEKPVAFCVKIEEHQAMKPIIHSVRSYDHPNIRTWEPDDPGDIALMLLLDIGPKGKKMADMFTLRLATPRGLLGLSARDGIVATRPLLVMDRFDFQLLWAWLEKTVAGCEGVTWNDCVSELRVYFLWEYEGMNA